MNPYGMAEQFSRTAPEKSGTHIHVTSENKFGTHSKLENSDGNESVTLLSEKPVNDENIKSNEEEREWRAKIGKFKKKKTLKKMKMNHSLKLQALEHKNKLVMTQKIW